MDTSLESHQVDSDAILNLIKDAIAECRESSSRLCGFARGLEIGISAPQGAEWTLHNSVERLQARSLRLSASRDDYQRGVALGIDLSTDIVSAMSSGFGHPGSGPPN